ncbi:MAG: hypothetical protein PUJ09_01025 [Eubacteriales bacterium]|nr:hypothetical protein [Eubacteriales bacterium]
MSACLTRNRTALQMPCGSVKSYAQNIMGDTAIGTTVLMVAVPGMVLGLILMMLKVKETKGVDMGAIRGDEFEGK